MMFSIDIFVDILANMLKAQVKEITFSKSIFVDILANMLKKQAKEMMGQRKAARASRRAELDAQVIYLQTHKGLTDSAGEGCMLADAQSYVLVIDELNISMSRSKSREKLSPRWRLS